MIGLFIILIIYNRFHNFLATFHVLSLYVDTWSADNALYRTPNGLVIFSNAVLHLRLTNRQKLCRFSELAIISRWVCSTFRHWPCFMCRELVTCPVRSTSLPVWLHTSPSRWPTLCLLLRRDVSRLIRRTDGWWLCVILMQSDILYQCFSL